MVIKLEGELIDLAVMGVGSGAKGAIAGYVKKFLPDVGVDIAGILAGGALYYFGDRIHPLVRKFGAGVLIGAIGQMTSGWTEGLIGEGEGGGSSHSSNPATTENSLNALAQAESGRPMRFS